MGAGVIRDGFFAILSCMPNRTDDVPRTKPQTAAAPDSSLAASPGASPALQTRDDHLLTQESFRAILSSSQRAGRWEAADEIDVRAICGDVTLDFTRAELPPSGVIEIDAWAIGGHIRIIVPDGAEIVLDGTPILGSIEQHLRKGGPREAIPERVTGEPDRAAAPAPQPPYFHIDCHAILGVIEVAGR